MTLTLWSSLLIIACIQAAFYLFAVSFRTDKVTDLAYGGTFVVLGIRGFLQSAQTHIHVILMCCLVLWGLRLAIYLFVRILNIGKDERFDEMRSNRISFGKFRLLQTISIWLIFLPSIFLFQSSGEGDMTWVIIGAIIRLIGLLLETIADRQKYTFKKEKPQQRVNIGVRKLARHPNYGGEMLVRWGIFIITSTALVGWQWIGIISPVFIMILLLYISGIPLLEKQHDKKYGHDKKYLKHKENTRLLFPLPK